MKAELWCIESGNLLAYDDLAEVERLRNELLLLNPGTEDELAIREVEA